MTHPGTCAPRRAAIPVAALAALLLAGCSTGHIGESWQCPLAEGGTCDSVAAADPAVPDAGVGNTVLAEPLWRVRGDVRAGAPAVGPDAKPPCEAGCDGGFDPFAWFIRLFDAHDNGGARPAATGAGPAAEAPPAAPANTASRTTLPAAAALPAEQPSLQGEPAVAEDEPASDDLRTEEVVARIWIAPFVDADGVYREASHVRVVLEPAGWRLK